MEAAFTALQDGSNRRKNDFTNSVLYFVHDHENSNGNDGVLGQD